MHLEDLKHSFLEEIKKVGDAKALEAVRIKYLGRKDGGLIKILRSLKDLPLAQKKKIGPAANALRKEIESALEKKLEELKTKTHKLKPGVDVTMPGKKISVGHLHPLTLMENRIREIFRGLNFSVVEGPEVETEHYNFDVLNIPANHPARDMWDTFWLKLSASSGKFARPDLQRKSGLGLKSSRLLLRTHTSPMQIRYMETHRPPFQIIVPGRVFRFEATDASHEINFHQVEGLVVGLNSPDQSGRVARSDSRSESDLGQNVSLANFKYIIEEFFRQLFGSGTHIRFRPSYFPFVEPGLEVDVKIQGSGIRNQESGWLEVMGAGMVHPNVFKGVGYDPRKVQGFAFGLGLERLAMIKYKIPDIRMFYSGDLRFINQF